MSSSARKWTTDQMITVKVEVGDREEHRVQREVRGVTLFTTVGMWVSGKFCWKIFLGALL